MLTLSNATGKDIAIDNFNHTTDEATIQVHSLDADGAENNTAESLEEGRSYAAHTDSLVAKGYVVFSDDQAFSVKSSGELAGSIVGVAAAISVASTASYVSAVNISTESGSTAALDVIDGALDRINSIRGDLGALQNRFEFTVSNLTGTSENLQSARSRIIDADFAQETAALARSQIPQQAGISVLAQANAQPQNILALLQ